MRGAIHLQLHDHREPAIAFEGVYALLNPGYIATNQEFTAVVIPSSMGWPLMSVLFLVKLPLWGPSMNGLQRHPTQSLKGTMGPREVDL